MNTSHPEIVKRFVNIEFSSSHALAWVRENSDYKNTLNAVSFTFPAGEKYFVKSVNFYMDRIKDPELKDRTRRFIYQEAMHAKEHDRANKFLLEVYPDGKLLERMTKVLFAISRRCKPRATQLATTCALEHFTALLAHVLLSRQEEFLVHSDEEFTNFWLWHAVEESEHKAVCFDVYEHIYGVGLLSYLHRISMMAFISFIFVLSLGTCFSIIAFKQKIQQLRHRLSGQKMKPPASTGTAKLSALFQGVAPSKYFDYYRRSFHPLNTDSSTLIQKWKLNHAEFGLARDISDRVETILPSEFDEQAYLKLNPDVARAGVDPVEHYVRHGHKEGRAYREARD